jgi:uncharacterized Zn finger protein
MDVEHVCIDCGHGAFWIVNVGKQMMVKCKKCGRLTPITINGEGLRPWRL